jgi:hypothetical protein
VDPPSTLWAAVQQGLAAEEIEQARRPAWRRAWSRWAPMLPRYGAGALVAAAAIALLWWRAHRDDAAPTPARPIVGKSDVVETNVKIGSSQHALVAPTSPPCAEGDDVTADLAGEAACVTARYRATADELLVLAREARARWSDGDRESFDARVSELDATIAAAAEGRPKQRALQAMIRYLQGAAVRDDVLLAAHGGAP